MSVWWQNNNLICARCGITEKQREKLPPMDTGINHWDHRYTKSFYIDTEKHTALCPECHKEKGLEELFNMMDEMEAKSKIKITNDCKIRKKK